MRPPKALLAASALVLAGIITAFLLTSRSSPLQMNGPIAGDLKTRSRTGAPANIDQALSFGGVILRNRGSSPAVIDAVRPVDADPGLVVVGTYLLGPDRRETIGVSRTFPPRLLGDAASAIKASVPPESASDGGRGFQIILGVKAVSQGLHRFAEVQVDYHVGIRRYRAKFLDGFFICAPMSAWRDAGKKCGDQVVGAL